MSGIFRTAARLVPAAVLSSSCAACAEPPPARDARAGAPAEKDAASDGPGWRTYGDGVSGFSVALPGEPKPLHHVIEGNRLIDHRGLALSDDDPATPDYTVSRLAPVDADAMLSLDGYVANVQKKWQRVDRDEKRTLAGLPAVEIEGEFLELPTKMVMTSLGGWVYVAYTQSSKGVDPAEAERFFESIRIEAPWKIEVYPDEALTVSLPAPVMKVPTAPEEGITTHVYRLGVPADLSFSVTWFPLSDERLRAASVDQILEDGVNGLAEGDGNQIDKVLPIEHGGVPGREIVHTAAGGVAVRSRMFVLGHRGYHVAALAMDATVLSQPAATRFLDSIRMGAAP